MLNEKSDVGANFAKRISKIYDLIPPINIKNLVSKYAKVVETIIPLEVDGVSVNLKNGKETKVFVNSQLPTVRKNFTLAHELGHIIIPWHNGLSIDIVEDEEKISRIIHYNHEIEAEANHFASELLIPTGWVKGLISEFDDLAELTKHISQKAKVSIIATIIKLAKILPAGNLYFITDEDGIITFSGRTTGTFAPIQEVGKLLDIEMYKSFADVYTLTNPTSSLYWIKASKKNDFLAKVKDNDWRSTLSEIFSDMDLSKKDKMKFNYSLNGKLGSAIGLGKTQGLDANAMYSACLQRFQGDEKFVAFREHPKFPIFLTKKILDNFSR